MKGVRVIIGCLCLLIALSFIMRMRGSMGLFIESAGASVQLIGEARDRDRDDGAGEQTEFC